jgi:casein kinase 1
MYEAIIGGNYKLGAKIGFGSFGQIYSAVNIKTQQDVAIKVEDVNTRAPQLIYEAKLYQAIHGDGSEPAEGFPKIHQCMTHSHYTLMVMDLMGPSLEDLHALCDKKFSLKTTLMIADQILARVEFLHNKGFLHRDIKPENFLIGTGKQQQIIHMIDFGLSKKYMRDRIHNEYADGKKLTGTARYSSINTHQGIEQSRRDDLEALGYVLIYLMKGSLPWQGAVKVLDKQERYNQIKDIKIQTSVETLCEDLPKEFADYIKYVRGLKYDEKPDYQMLRDMFKKLFYQKKYVEDYEFDWVVKAKEGKINLLPKSLSDTKDTGYDFMLSSVDVKVVGAKSKAVHESSKACFSLFSCFA